MGFFLVNTKKTLRWFSWFLLACGKWGWSTEPSDTPGIVAVRMTLSFAFSDHNCTNDSLRPVSRDIVQNPWCGWLDHPAHFTKKILKRATLVPSTASVACRCFGLMVYFDHYYFCAQWCSDALQLRTEVGEVVFILVQVFALNFSIWLAAFSSQRVVILELPKPAAELKFS